MADVTVRGAGIFGLSVAWACARRGAAVQVIDPAGPGAGASGGIVGALAPHVPENWNDKKAFQLDSLLMAETFWAEVAEISGRSPGYARTGRLQPLEPGGAALAEARAGWSRSLWQGRAVWRVADAAEFAHTPECEGGRVIHDTLTARLHPAQACAALAAALKVKGGVIRTEGDDEGRVIRAIGAADLAALNAVLPRQVGAAIKGQAALMDLALPDHPQIFANGVHIVPHEDGTTAIGSTTERDFDGLGTDALLDEVIAAARAAFAPLRDARVIRRWAGLRPRTRSRAPMLGAHPLHPGQFIANGGFKIGFGMAPKVGEVMADLVLEGLDAIPEGFRPEASL
ncbi:FAD-dependent oxidoreductase [Pelagivirga sediminicola]|uniref:FAD-dependent oxidoreductase n=1 Tax=Pelagivirga sediminicola TaxID=2170575 RepID=A0A2T7G9S0_9RHOB|nr:FAD-binding oxidoreductase [Pelagivirga sediminicola]PVA11146.1 FAD-dependent oxidoreductase [Pelagivirga sediminicola]